MMKARTLLILLGTFTMVVVFCATVASAQTKPLRPKTADPCAEANLRGFADGYERGLADAGFLDTSIRLGKEPLPIQIMVEEFEDAAAYQLAAAELISSRFPSLLKVVPKSELTLYITGFSLTTSNVRSVGLRVEAFSEQEFRVGTQTHRVAGEFVIANEHFVLRNYSPQEATQDVRERLYDLLSKFAKTWQESTPGRAKQ